jgi:hypothetical protein
MFDLAAAHRRSMCFSAEVDLVAGLAITAIGVDAVRHSRYRTELPLAMLPVLFGIHQIIESVVWWGLEGRIADGAWHAARWAYLAIAFGVVPVWVPLAVGALEGGAMRRRTRWFTAVGTAVAVVLMVAVVRGPIESTIEGRHIAYRVDLWQGGVLVALYLVATCGVLLQSEHVAVRRFGAVNLAAVSVLVALDQGAFISLWCAWAAVTSAAIALHLRARPGDPVVRLFAT